MPHHYTNTKPLTALSIKTESSTWKEGDVGQDAPPISPVRSQHETLLKIAPTENNNSRVGSQFIEKASSGLSVDTAHGELTSEGGNYHLSGAAKSPRKKTGQNSTPLAILKSNVISDADNSFYSNLFEFIPGRLYFDSPRQSYSNIPKDAMIFNVDNEFQYVKFYLDFGPPNIAQILKFTRFIQDKLDRNPDKKIILICSPTPDKTSNSALLLCCYMVLKQGKTPSEATRPLQDVQKNNMLNIAPYRDAGYGAATYWITIQDCVNALYIGLYKYKLLDLESFDVEEYEFYERVENGDMNWVVPRYFVALASPQDTPPAHFIRYHEEVRAGNIIPPKPLSKRFKPLNHVEDLVGYLKNKMNIKALVRLNNKLYDRQRVINSGMNHYELYFPDGSVPPWDTIVKNFMLICDTHLSPYPYASDPNRGALAVHCKAGLGRTGSLICCWLIKTLGMSARECISWCRLMRPGSVVGPQQNWLESVEHNLLKWGEDQRHAIAAHIALSSEKALSNKSLSVNDGTDVVAEQTFMGMHVPMQPRKGQSSASGSEYDSSSSDLDLNELQMGRLANSASNSSEDLSRKSNKRKTATGKERMVVFE